MVADPPSLITRLSQVEVISDRARLEALGGAKGALGWNDLMAPTLGRRGEVVSCDGEGDFLVRFEPQEAKEKGREKEEEESGARKGSVFFGSAMPRLPVSFYYPPQALRLVSGGEPTQGARVRVRGDGGMYAMACESMDTNM